MSKAAAGKPGLRVVRGGELSLSGESLLGLLEAVLAKGVPFRFRARGFSMSPLIKDGDVLTVAPRGEARLRPGDTVAFINPLNGKPAVHRIIRLDRGSVVVKGDNVAEPDGLVPERDVLGIVTSVERRGKKVRFGLGAEGRLIAFFSSRGLFRLPLSAAKRVFRPVPRRRAGVKKSYVVGRRLPDIPLWERMRQKRGLIGFDYEITARCNLNCRHCYINLPAGDRRAKERELSLAEIERIADEAASLGAVWCLLSGGEPLLREDFREIYLMLKRKGLLLSVFTNATLVREEHVRLFREYPPREIEVTVYGATEATYEKVTRTPGSFRAFRKGLDLLLENGLKVRLKTMGLRTNIGELPAIAAFCRERTKDFFRFDPFLHLRFDRDEARNEDIRSERLSPEEIVALEKNDRERFRALEKNCDKLIVPEFERLTCGHLLHCGAGLRNFTLGYEGTFRLCSSLWHPDCVMSLKEAGLRNAWENLVPQVREMESGRKDFLERCRVCPLVNLCLWCAAHAYLETGELDKPVDYFCRVAHAREAALRKT